MAKKLAFMTYGHLLADRGDPQVQGFVERVPGVYAAAEGSSGFRARSERSDTDPSHSWGPIVAPKCWGGQASSITASTLSLWDDIESVAAFAYHGAHGEAMKLRNEWFVHKGLPEHVGWWVDEGEPIDWQSAADKMDLLHELGSTPEAFSLRKPFDSAGEPYRLDPALVRSKAAAKM